MSTKKILNFQLPAKDVARAAAFYRAVFGWEFEPHADAPEAYWVDANPGQTGVPAAIAQRNEFIQAPVPTIEVDDIDAALMQVAVNGGRQAAVRDIPGVGRFAYAMDCEDNVIALMQRG